MATGRNRTRKETTDAFAAKASAFAAFTRLHRLGALRAADRRKVDALFDFAANLAIGAASYSDLAALRAVIAELDDTGSRRVRFVELVERARLELAQDWKTLLAGGRAARNLRSTAAVTVDRRFLRVKVRAIMLWLANTRLGPKAVAARMSCACGAFDDRPLHVANGNTPYQHVIRRFAAAIRDAQRLLAEDVATK
jgi:hypothetical protein